MGEESSLTGTADILVGSNAGKAGAVTKPLPYNAFMRARPLACITLLSASTVALANGAMGYALEIFDFRYWAIYVVVTVIFEAWVIGRGLGFSWPKSLAISALANLITAWGCASGCFAVLFHFGPNPNPILYTVNTLVFFGLVSALIEAVVWGGVASKLEARGHVEKPVGKSLLAHALGVPLALLILLIPARPYPGMEAVAAGSRQRDLKWLVGKAFFVGYRGNEAVYDPPESLQELQAGLKRVAPGKADILLCAPEYSRFATGESCAQKMTVEFNPDPPGKRLWVFKVYEPGRPDYGIVFTENLSGWFFWPEHPFDKLFMKPVPSATSPQK